MPTNKTDWMMARSVTVQGYAHPGQYEDSNGDGNEVGCVVIQRASGIGSLAIQGRPEDLVALAERITAAAAWISMETESSPALRSLYGRV